MPDSVSVSGDVVIGYATGYGPAQVAVFVRSLRAHYAGRAVLIVDANAEMDAFVGGYGIETMPGPDRSGWCPEPVVSRFSDYANILASIGQGRALLTDVRDVVFQGDPFADCGSLEVFSEFDGNGLSPFTRKHVARLAGVPFADSMLNKPSLCAGTIRGAAPEVARLSRLIVTLCGLPRWGIGGHFGADQAALNFAVHSGLIAAEVIDNYGPVATLDESKTYKVLSGRILNADGSHSPIVHQYDRHDDLVTEVHGLWGDGFPTQVRRSPKTLSDHWKKAKVSTFNRLPELR